MTLLYFAWLKSKLGIGEEQLDRPASVQTVGDLLLWLQERGAAYAEAFSNPSLIRAAVNQEHVDMTHPVQDGDEVAFFPPVTGG